VVKKVSREATKNFFALRGLGHLGPDTLPLARADLADACA
jgi:hypothetical protein